MDELLAKSPDGRISSCEQVVNRTEAIGKPGRSRRSAVFAPTKDSRRPVPIEASGIDKCGCFKR
jgi:hypothetical protein